MPTNIHENEQNLFRATAAMARFYEELEIFMDMLIDAMAEEEFGIFGERLRSGTFVHRNLTRRLLATSTLVFFKGTEDQDLEPDAADETDAEETSNKKIITVEKRLVIPFASLWLFRPKLVPSLQSLDSPKLIFGTIGNLTFHDRKTDKQLPDRNCDLALSNLAQLSPSISHAVGNTLSVKCNRPSAMRGNLLKAKILKRNTRRLFELDSQEKIQSIARELAKLANQRR